MQVQSMLTTYMFASLSIRSFSMTRRQKEKKREEVSGGGNGRVGVWEREREKRKKLEWPRNSNICDFYPGKTDHLEVFQM